MSKVALFVLCIQALLIQSITANCLRSNCLQASNLGINRGLYTNLVGNDKGCGRTFTGMTNNVGFSELTGLQENPGLLEAPAATSLVAVDDPGYGGIGSGNVFVLGDLGVRGSTYVNGEVPVNGFVMFRSGLPARGFVTISGCTPPIC